MLYYDIPRDGSKVEAFAEQHNLCYSKITVSDCVRIWFPETKEGNNLAECVRYQFGTLYAGRTKD